MLKICFCYRIEPLKERQKQVAVVDMTGEYLMQGREKR